MGNLLDLDRERSLEVLLSRGRLRLLDLHLEDRESRQPAELVYHQVVVHEIERVVGALEKTLRGSETLHTEDLVGPKQNRLDEMRLDSSVGLLREGLLEGVDGLLIGLGEDLLSLREVELCHLLETGERLVSARTVVVLVVLENVTDVLQIVERLGQAQSGIVLGNHVELLSHHLHLLPEILERHSPLRVKKILRCRLCFGFVWALY